MNHIIRTTVLAFLCLFSFVAESIAQATLTDYTRQNVIAYDFHSNTLNRDFIIEIGQPLSATSSTTDPEVTFPVVYTHDAEMMFPHMSIGNQLQEVDQKIPAMYTVSINYPHTASAFENAVWRFSDLTADAALLPGVPFPLGGGADAFLEFINSELKPFINETFRIDEEQEFYYGHSLGGLFGLHALFASTDSFDKYLISSPSVWWNDKSIVQTVEAFIDANDDLVKRVHLVVGGDERPEDPTAEGVIDMVADMKEIYWKLKMRHFPGLQISQKVYHNEGHVSVVIPSYYYGMRTLMDDVNPFYRYQKPFTKYEDQMKKHMEKMRKLLEEHQGW
ncbi:MAG: hypothetical protein K6L76_13965 [Agarilytica sp.]